MVVAGLGSLSRSRTVHVWCIALGVVLATFWPTVTGCGGSKPSGIAPSGEWAAPTSSVLAAFDDAADTLGRTVYVPAELPAGVGILPLDSSPLPLESMSAQSVISLAVGDGRLDVLQGVQGDLGDVEGVACGEVAGRPAKVFDLLGGHLVQWEQDGSWYGVFGLDVPSETVVRVALSMERS